LNVLYGLHANACISQAVLDFVEAFDFMTAYVGLG